MADIIRVLLADEHPVVCFGLRAVLASEPAIEVIGETADGIAAVEQARAIRPDVLLLALLLPGKDGLQVIAELAETAPSVRIVVFTSVAADEPVRAALKAGALGYLLKRSSPDELVAAIPSVAGGGSSFDPAVTRQVLRMFTQPAVPSAANQVTARELEILRLVAHGLSNRDIARQLSLSERTVRTHVSAILSKLGLRSRTQAALYALRTGLAQLPEEL
jgi:NarL family two-component system response regulator LiaR